MTAPSTAVPFTLLCHLDYGDHGAAAIIRHDGSRFSVQRLESTSATTLASGRAPVFIGLAPQDRIHLMDPVSRETRRDAALPRNTFAPYAYRDAGSNRLWFVFDGDDDGNDINCNHQGSPVYIVANTGERADVVEKICLGRGHHVVAFSRPTAERPDIPHRAFVTNLNDGNMAVIGNDPNDAITFLKVITTLNLGDPAKEKDGTTGVPNNAFPHGMDYSPVTGKIYNLNNGYCAVTVIDPISHKIEARIPMPQSSNLLLSRCGRYFIGKGADRKKDAEHVVGRLSVLDVTRGETVVTLDIPDFYPSTYRFNPRGDRLYVTAATTGKGAQADNLRTDIVQVYDATALPQLKLLREIEVDTTTAGRRPIAFLEHKGEAAYVFVSNPTQGTVTILDGTTDATLTTVEVGAGNVTEFAFSYWNDRQIYGA